MGFTNRIVSLLFARSSCVLACLASFGSYGENISNQMRLAHVPGVSLTYIQNTSHQDFNHSLNYSSSAYGVASLRRPELINVNSVFEAASNGKVIAAYGIHLLIERGALNLTDKIKDDRVQSNCGPITLAEVLSHTAGLGNQISAEAFIVDCKTRGTFSYAGEGYVLLDKVIEQSGGQTSEAFIQDNIFEPLAMNNSTMGRSDNPIVDGHPDLLFGFLTQRGPKTYTLATSAFLLICVLLGTFTAFKFWSKSRWLAAGSGAGLFMVLFLLVITAITRVPIPIASQNRANDVASTLKTSSADLARFAAELMSPTLMSQKQRDVMFSPQVEVNARVSWGLGIGIDNSFDNTSYWHWGSNPGYQSLMVVDLDKQKGFVMLTNGGGFADFITSDLGGYNLAKKLGRSWLEYEGHWSIASPD